MAQSRQALPPPAVLDRLEAAESVLSQRVVYRVLVLRRGQVAALPTDFQRENTAGARWNPTGVAALYTSMERETAGAEGGHLSAANDLPTSRFQIGEMTVRLQRVLDLSDPAALQEIGMGKADIESDDLGPCQIIGSASSWLGMSGMLVPSARRWPTTNLVVFPGNFDGDDSLEPAGDPDNWQT